MNKKIFTLLVAATVFMGNFITVSASSAINVVFNESNQLIYENATETGSSVILGDAFEGIAPGETRTQTITLTNRNDVTVDFYMSTEVISALEASNAVGAGYEVLLAVGGVEIYNSKLGGYSNTQAASGEGLSALNESALADSIFAKTLAKGESTDVVLQIFFDGEAMDNQQIDYSNKEGALSFSFLVGYEEPSSANIVYRTITKKGETRYIIENGEMVEIADGETPLAVLTGDNASIFGAIVLFLIGASVVVGTCFIGKKKKVEDSI